MLQLSFPRVRNDRAGVSEVVGTLLVLVMTVALFSVIILWVYGFPAPESEARCNLFPSMDRINATHVDVAIIHRGGEPITSGSIQVLFTIHNSTYDAVEAYNYTAGATGKQWVTGGVWSKVISPMPEDAWVELRVVDTYHQAMLLRTDLQRGTRGSNSSPILGAPIALPDWLVTCNGRDSFYVRTAAVDYDGDLPNSGVKLDLNALMAGWGTVTFNHRGFGIYETDSIVVPSSVHPGEYSLKVTATDSKGHTDTGYVAVKIVSDDKDPPTVQFIRPNSGEIAAGTANVIVASYSDPSGINKDSVTLRVWEDNMLLDTSTKVVTDTTVTFRPFGGFKQNSFYMANVSVEDSNGNIAYAETVFRMTFYSEPGNPRGETNFALMNKTWISMTVFEHDDYIRVQLWSEIMKRLDESELRLTRSDMTKVFVFRDRLVPNLTVPEYSVAFPFYVYDGTIRVGTDGAYGAAIPPGFYTLKVMGNYPDGNVIYENEIRVTILYPDGSLPTNGRFFLYNETFKWVTPTNTFYETERVYVQIVSDHIFARSKTYVNKVIIKIADMYGIDKLYVELPPEQLTYVGPGMGGYIYRCQFNMTDTIGGAQWLYGANWYPIDISVQTKTQWFRNPVWKWWKSYTTYQIEYQAGDQVRVIRPADISIVPADIVIYHTDGSTFEENATVLAGESLIINVTVRNLGMVDIYNARVDVSVVSGGVAIEQWQLDTDSELDCYDPNYNGWIDATAGVDYVSAEILWDTSMGGHPQAVLDAALVRVHIEIEEPVIGGYGSEPIPETNYDNNDAEKRLVPLSTGRLTITTDGYVAPTTVDVGEQTFLVMRLRATAAGGPVRVIGINVTLTGTATATDISRVAIYRDTFTNGALDRGDRLLSQGVFAAGVFKATDNTLVQDGSSVVYLIVYDISGTATATRTCGARIAVSTAFNVQPPAYVVNSGYPLNSGMATISANANTLTGAISGPTGAFLETTLRYTIVWTASGTGSLTITQLKMTVTNPTWMYTIRLLDNYGQTIQEQTSAATVTFTNVAFCVRAGSPRTMYVELDLNSVGTEGSNVGISIGKTDPTLSCAADSVSNSLSLSKTSTIRTMAYFFAYGADGPTLDKTSRAYIYNVNIGTTDATIRIELEAISVSWTSTKMPNFLSRFYIDGGAVFEDDGANHVGNGITAPLTYTVELSSTMKAVRMYFDTYVTGKGGDKRNTITITWYFADGSSSTGGKSISCKDASASWS